MIRPWTARPSSLRIRVLKITKEHQRRGGLIFTRLLGKLQTGGDREGGRTVEATGGQVQPIKTRTVRAGPEFGPFHASTYTHHTGVFLVVYGGWC